MSKQLLIVRHAKSDWGNAEITDFNRPLNERGKANVPEMAKRLKDRNINPEIIISSSANRAISTAKLMASELGLKRDKIYKTRKIYEASCNQLLAMVNGFDNSIDFIALFGHNNGITDLTVYLTDADIFNIPTCGVVLVKFPFDDWKMVSKFSGEVDFFDYPKKPEFDQKF
ncbi:MAG: histidine phosphatase family protein [Pelobium sp.]